MIFRNSIDIQIFTIDTGRMFNESYELMDKISARYGKNIRTYFPKAEDVEQLVSTKGMNSFYESVENRKECCAVRKIRPLNRALEGAEVWITGLRADQSDNRMAMPMIEWLDDRKMYKFNPLLHWKLDDVLEYISKHNVPYNVLHDRNFISIGCAPCTRAISAGEDPRAGRWWWEVSKKECGLHGN
jgi:phosphoadenosine phosphosulfate reductase